jgi:hypothetical protein
MNDCPMLCTRNYDIYEKCAVEFSKSEKFCNLLVAQLLVCKSISDLNPALQTLILQYKTLVPRCKLNVQGSEIIC